METGKDDLNTVNEATSTLDSLGYKQQLNRAMSLTDVVVHGLIYMVPMAPMAVFGFIYNFSFGMVSLVYLVAAIAMTFSALSYKEMAKRYPVAGSVYSYVRFGINEYVGYLAGWAILLDYLLLPALLSVFAAVAMTGIWPIIPAWVWIVLFVVLAALINLGGITLTATMNKTFLAIQFVVMAIFAIAVGVDLVQGNVTLSLQPFYNSDVFSWSIVFGAIPIASLSFIGFDAISTVNEEARGGGATVSKATMIVLVAVAFLFVAQVYLAGLYIPTGTHFGSSDETNNAFYNVAGQAGGDILRILVTMTSALIAIFANSIASQATSSRLVFSMARDHQLPTILSGVGKKKTPRNAILLIAGLSLVIGLLGNGHQEVLTTMVTFGALTAYVLLNIAVIVRFGFIEGSRRYFLHWLSPVLGTIIILFALWHGETHAKIIGSAWMLIGILIALFLRWRGRLGP